jgi:hypothetical protein
MIWTPDSDLAASLCIQSSGLNQLRLVLIIRVERTNYVCPATC